MGVLCGSTLGFRKDASESLNTAWTVDLLGIPIKLRRSSIEDFVLIMGGNHAVHENQGSL